MSIDLSACPQASSSVSIPPFYSAPVSLHHSFIALSSPPSIPLSFPPLPSHLCDALCATFPRTIHFTRSSPLPTGFISFFFFTTFNLTPSHALSISCGLSGLQSRCNGRQAGQIAQRHINLPWLTVRTPEQKSMCPLQPLSPQCHHR